MKRGPVQRFTIYVLELKGVRYKNDLYVGSTVDLAKRLKEHRASGLRFKLRRGLTKPARCLTRGTAERLERELAARLRRQGYRVDQS